MELGTMGQNGRLDWIVLDWIVLDWIVLDWIVLAQSCRINCGDRP
jgi:hypothetical protein